MFNNKKMKDRIGMSSADRDRIVHRAGVRVSRGVFYSTIIIIASFLPVFILTGQEGKLFHPLVWTKTFILVIDALLVITLAPVIISLVMRGKPGGFKRSTAIRRIEKGYEALLRLCLHWRKTTLAVNLIAVAISIPMMMSMGTEFMPSLDERSILFMPVALPDISNTEIKRILQVQDKIIASFPEVAQVLGKAGRAQTATDNAPINMIETLIMLKPRAEWRAGITKEEIVRQLNDKLQIPGVVNGWTQPIINRINMLSTGIRTDVGIKIHGQDLDTIYALSAHVKKMIREISGVTDLYVEPVSGGKYLVIDIERDKIARFGVDIRTVNEAVGTLLGGGAIGTTIEGRKRFPISIRLPEDFRNSVDKLKRIAINTTAGSISLSAIARIRYAGGPPMISSDNGLLRGAVLFDVRGRDLGSTVQAAMEKIDSGLTMPDGYFIEWSGQYENLIHGKRTLLIVTPVVLAIIFISLYLAFGSFREALLTLLTVPFALIGGVWIIYAYGVSVSVAVAVGFIALFGIAVETGIVMVIYLNDAMSDLIKLKGNSIEQISRDDLREYVVAGAAKRLRPKLMTVCVSLFGLVPVLWSHGVGSDVMLPIVLPMIGGVFTSATHILLVTPLIFLMTKEYELKKYKMLQVMSHDIKS